MDISKLDASKRQIETAILLYFRSKDPVSIHTLISAGHQLLYDITERNKVESIFDKLINTIKPEKRKDVIKKLTEAKNFFKHAKGDRNKIMNRIPEQSDRLLRDSIQMYVQITGELSDYMKLYNLWRLLSKNDNFTEEYKELYKKAKETAEQLGILNNKEKFLEELLPIMSGL